MDPLPLLPFSGHFQIDLRRKKKKIIRIKTIIYRRADKNYELFHFVSKGCRRVDQKSRKVSSAI